MAVIGYGLWQLAFAGDPAIIGRTLHIAGAAPTVIGIMPPGFAWPEKTEFSMPMTTFGDPGSNVRTEHDWHAVGRLQADVPMARGRADIRAIERRIKKEHPSAFQSRTRQWFTPMTSSAKSGRPY